jgi:Ca2+/Na+ antiporter
MKDKTDFLWGMYQEHTTQGRHHEVQRATVTNFIIIVAGGVLAFVANGGVARDKWVLAVFLIVIGLFGALFSAKQYERFRFHVVVAGKYRKELERLLDNSLTGIREAGLSKHKSEFSSSIVKLRLHYFWIALHLLIMSLGVTLLIMTLRK